MIGGCQSYITSGTISMLIFQGFYKVKTLTLLCEISNSTKEYLSGASKLKIKASHYFQFAPLLHSSTLEKTNTRT